MSYELILPFLRPIEPFSLDETIGDIMGSSDASSWYEPDGIVQRATSFSFEAGGLPSRRFELNWNGRATSVTFVFSDNAKHYELAVNRLGLTIVYFLADQAFE